MTQSKILRPKPSKTQSSCSSPIRLARRAAGLDILLFLGWVPATFVAICFGLSTDPTKRELYDLIVNLIFGFIGLLILIPIILYAVALFRLRDDGYIIPTPLTVGFVTSLIGGCLICLILFETWQFAALILPSVVVILICAIVNCFVLARLSKNAT